MGGMTVIEANGEASDERIIAAKAKPVGMDWAQVVPHSPHEVLTNPPLETHAQRMAAVEVVRAHLQVEHDWSGRSQDYVDVVATHANLHLQLAKHEAAVQRKAAAVGRRAPGPSRPSPEKEPSKPSTGEQMQETAYERAARLEAEAVRLLQRARRNRTTASPASPLFGVTQVLSGGGTESSRRRH